MPETTRPRVILHALFILAALVSLHYFTATRTTATSPWLIAEKGASVALLALWAALQARSLDGWLIAGVLALGALGDVLIESHGLTAGALAFLAGHLVAILLYLRNRTGKPWIALALTLTVAAIAQSLPADRSAAPGVALYAAGLGAMAGTAWISRFPRWTVGLGALLFVASDLLIFARLGPLAGSSVPDLLVWPLYFAGQALIAWGLVATFGKEERS